jgi:hypothetical protein
MKELYNKLTQYMQPTHGCPQAEISNKTDITGNSTSTHSFALLHYKLQLNALPTMLRKQASQAWEPGNRFL